MGDSTKRPIGPAQGSERLLQRDSEFDGYRIHRVLGRGAGHAVAGGA